MDDTAESRRTATLVESTLAARVTKGELPPRNVQAGAAALSLLVYASTGDAVLAARVLECGLTAAALTQPCPMLSSAACELLTAEKSRLCGAVGIEAHTYREPRARAIRALAADLPVSTDTLYPASRLTNARLRVALSNVAPHYHRVDDRHVRCEHCRRGVEVRTDEELRALIYAPVWSTFRWKTLLCAGVSECRAAADRAMADDRRCVCHNCFRTAANTTVVRLVIARADDPSRPRELPLCAECRRQCAVQLATVEYTGP